ncbi:DUF6710 family protein [Enterovibrio calviensis]|uniref:DUF6710 family protein n=1 Tax=Enterovibrio calviensis TaxID=91359 RepID=UPI00048614B5|nr:DUF6710 family protein [Enterovibrio calviensis]
MELSTEFVCRDDELANLLRRADALVDDSNIEGLRDLQRTVWRQLQSKFLLQPYLVKDHSSWTSIEHNDFEFDCVQPSTHELVTVVEAAFINLRSEPAITSPWHPQRIIRNLGTIGDGLPKGPFAETSNHSVNYYWPLNLALVTGGNHSIAQGLLRGQGTVKVEECFDLTPIVEQVFYDGDSWVLFSSGKRIRQPRFKEIGWAWELGRILMRHSTFHFTNMG